jgi:hypothetical protein
MKKYLHGIGLVALVLLGACNPEPDSKQLIDQLVVATNYDTNADFQSYTTYAMPNDTIGFISNTSDDTVIVANKSTFPRPVLAAIKSNLDARGYRQVNRNQSPDLGIKVVVVNDFNVFQQIVYPNYYGGYPGYYGGGYYPGYYGYSSFFYYPYINTYAYNTGVLVVEILDLKNKTANNQVKVIWDAYMGDLYSTLDRIPETVNAVNQAFTQSPYVEKGAE